MWRAYVGYGSATMDVLDVVVDQCPPKMVTVTVKSPDEYAGPEELIDVRGVLCVLTSEPPESQQPGEALLFRRIVRDFRDGRTITAVDGFYPGSGREHRVGVLQVLYTDHALNDPIYSEIIAEACHGHPYTPGVPFTGNVFEVFEPGKAQLVKKNDQLAVAHATLRKRLRRWGVDDIERARLLRREIEHEVDALEKPGKRAMYRPIPGIHRNRLWLVLHDTDARPPADANKTEEENHKTEELYVANGARAVRTLVERLEFTFEWFRQPEDTKARGAQNHFAQLYDALRIITRTS